MTAATSKAPRLLISFLRTLRETATDAFLACFGYGTGGIGTSTVRGLRPLLPRRVLRVVLLLLLVAHYVGQQWHLASRYFQRNADDATIVRDSFRSIATTTTNATQNNKEQDVPTSVGNSKQRANDRRQHQHQQPMPNQLKVVYVGEFGLGHRLSKMSAAYHLVQLMILKKQNHQPTLHRRDSATRNMGIGDTRDVDITGMVLEASWGTCDWENGTTVDIFTSLFGPEPLLTSLSDDETTSASASLQRRHQLESAATHPTPTILIRNDVKGYYAGQMYKNAQTKLTPELLKAWDYKMQTSDLQLFHQLLGRFRFRDEAVNYQRDHNWNSYFVVGIHFRLGNGEQDHFAASQRAIADAQRLVDQTIQLVLQYREDVRQSSGNASVKGSSHGKPWAIFVASDTPAVMSMVQDALNRFQSNNNTGIQLWASPSLSHLPDRGVSYTLTKADACWEGWKYAMLDQYLLSHVQLLVAPTRSTFTQIVPRAMVMSPQAPPPPPPPPEPNGFDRASTGSGMGGGTFCEIEFDSSGMNCPPRMVCHTDSLDWLLRQNGTGRVVVQIPYTMDQDLSKGIDVTDTCHLIQDESHTSYVPHKLLVHLPEGVHEWEFARDEFRTLIGRRADAPGTSTAVVVGRYGERFAQKYRNYAFRPEWSPG